MKKFNNHIFILMALICSLGMNAKELYPLALSGANGAFEVYQSGSSNFNITNSELLTTCGYRKVSAKFRKQLSNGWSLYKSTTNLGGMRIIEEYVVSPDRFHVIEISGNGNRTSSITWYTSSRSERAVFYSKNKNNQRKGIDFSETFSDSPSSSRSHSSNGTCTQCNGTKINPTPNTGGSRYNWVAYYNRANNKCPYCGKYSQHYHDRCYHCNVPTR